MKAKQAFDFTRAWSDKIRSHEVTPLRKQWDFGEGEEGNETKQGKEDKGMEYLRLVEPSETYAEDIWAFRKEIMEKDVDNADQFAGCISLDSSNSAVEWIEICRLRKDERTCEQVGTTVPSHMYLAIRNTDQRIVGVIDLRHHINHPILGTWGGHSGYSVRPSERGKGYATEMLCLLKEKAAERGIERMLMTCAETNRASEGVIVANGGVFEKKIDVEGTTMKRYWIETEGKRSADE